METIHRAFYEAVARVPEHVLAKVIADRLSAQGVSLPRRGAQLIERSLRAQVTAKIRLRPWRWWDRREITVEPEDLHVAEDQLEAFFDRKLPALTESAMRDIAALVLATLKRRWPRQSQRQRRDSSGFGRRLARRWKPALESLRMLLTMALELGAEVNQEARGPDGIPRRNLVEVLTRLHARACQVTQEVVCLLQNGLADGAMARWRTLHEIAVVALLVSEKGEELAERYVAHQVIESRRAALEYRQYQERLGLDPFPEEQFTAFEELRAAAIQRYGPAFANQYGWAADCLGSANPTFADIERSIGVDHLRPYYRMASHNVHANPKGIFFKLGLLDEAQLLLAGPSDMGLADPGPNAAISLLQASASLGVLTQTMDSIVVLQMMCQVAEQTRNAFAEVDDRMKRGAAQRD